MATRRVSKNLQQGRSGGEGTGYRGDNTCQKNQEARYNLDTESISVNRFCGRRPDGIAINEAVLMKMFIDKKESTCLVLQGTCDLGPILS